MIAADSASTAPPVIRSPATPRDPRRARIAAYRAQTEQRQRGDRVRQPDVAVLEEEVVVRAAPDAGERSRLAGRSRTAAR